MTKRFARFRLEDISLLNGKAPWRWVVLGSGVFVTFGLFFGWLTLTKPLISKPSGKIFWDEKGSLLRFSTSVDEKFRIRRDLSKISQQAIDLTLFIEDRHFYRHFGFNPVSLAKSFISSYVTRHKRRGGSTITMQLARLLFRLNTQTIPGKILQIARAVQLEVFYSKAQILEAYLNLAPYGNNIEGIEAASVIYFGKPAEFLDFYEALALVLIPQDPNDRILKINDANFLSRRLALARSFAKKHLRTKLDETVVAMPLSVNGLHDLLLRAPHFTDYVSLGEPGMGEYNTTLNLDLQTEVENIGRQYLTEVKDRGIDNYATLIVDSQTMQVKTMVGSANFFSSDTSGQVNATHSRRSPGSLLKPFVYGLAFDQGLLHPLTLLKDSPMAIGAYAPENFDLNFRGPISVTQALNKSRNIPAVKTLSLLNNPDLYDLLNHFGIGELKPKAHYGLSIVLGTAELTMLEIAQLYATLANQGRFKPLHFLKSQPPKGPQQPPQLLSAASAFLTLDMLRKNPRPTLSFHNTMLQPQVPVGWKTGTSWGFRDAWAVGIVGHYIIAVWFGHFDGRANPAFIGAELAGPLLFRLTDLLAARENFSQTLNLLPPENVTQIEVCAISGGLPEKFCPILAKTYFIKGKSPITPCSIHRQVRINKKSRLLACPSEHNAKQTETRVYEYWPSDLLALFRQAGLPRLTPPAMDPSCSQKLLGEFSGKAPEISSPQPGLVYQLRSKDLGKGDMANGRIPLDATIDADSRKLFWFVDKTYIGSVPNGEIAFWTPTLGDHVVQVIDEQGRGSSRKIQVKLVD